MPHFEPYTPIPHTRVFAHNENAILIVENDATIAIVDQFHTRICYPTAASFYLGIAFLKFREYGPLVTFRAEIGEIMGFALGKDSNLLCLLTTAPCKRPDIPEATKLLATPQGLHMRMNSTQDWTTLLWLPPN